MILAFEFVIVITFIAFIVHGDEGDNLTILWINPTSIWL